MFAVKKIASIVFMPLPMGLMIAVIGLLLLWFTKRQRWGKVLTSAAFLAIGLMSYGPLANSLLTPLEKAYPRYEASGRPVAFVVVLGGGHLSDKRLPLTSQISSVSLARLIEGIRIYKEHPGSKLVLSGWGASDPVSNAVVMYNIAQSIGVPGRDIIVEPRPRDTTEEALLMKGIVKDRPFVLVTSASHMKRAVSLFKGQTLNPIPAPTYYLVRGAQRWAQVPSASGLEKSECAFHEYLGMAWARVMGHVER